MRGKRYDVEKRRVLSGNGYIGVIIAILVLAALVATTLLVLLPTTEDPVQEVPTIVSINYDYNEIGAGSDSSQVYFTVTYSDGTTESVSLSNMVCEGLDVKNISGVSEQTISLSYGGFEDTIKVNVKNIDCKLKYDASPGGIIRGDSTQTITSGGNAATVVAVPETGYVFDGWSDGYPYASRQDLRVNESKEYIANFSKEKFEVVFFFRDGSTVKSEKVTYGDAAVNIPDYTDPRMTVYGYTFMGWSIAEEDYKSVTRNLEIYPRYEKTATDVSVEVSQDDNGNYMGSTDANECGYYAYNESAVIVAKPDNSREFNYWTVKNSDGEYVNIGKDSTEEKIVEIGDKRVQVPFRVTQAADGQGQYSISFTCNEQIDHIWLTAEFAYAESNLTFVNMQNSTPGNVECSLDDIKNGQELGDRIGEVDLKGTDGNYITIDSDVNSVNFGLPIPKKVAGLKFVGWYIQSDPTHKIINYHQQFTQPTVIVAKWEKLRYEIVFEYENEYGVLTQMPNSTIYVYYQDTLGSGGGIPAMIPERNHYVFQGWYDAQTGEIVDDMTQIILHDEYDMSDEGDFANQRIKLIAKWEAKTHVLTVKTNGEGYVLMSSTFEGIPTTVEVNGNVIIMENRTYSISFSANKGYKVSQVVWEYGNVFECFTDDSIDSKLYNIHIQGEAVENDNAITVDFSPREYTLTIQNGTAFTRGYVIMDNGQPRDGEIITTKISAFSSAEFKVQSGSDSYAIKNIYVIGQADGTTYTGEAKYSYEGMDAITSSEVILRNVSSDISVRIEYEGRVYGITVNQGAEGMIKQTSYNGKPTEYVDPEHLTEYVYGERVFYAMQAKEGEYITGVVMDGITHGLYELSKTICFYDWEINGQNSGVTLIYIDDVYYYCYGSVTVSGTRSAGTNSYIYCENIEDGSICVFYYDDESAGEYILTETDSDEGRELVATMERELDIKNRRITDGTVEKDQRITSVKLMLVVTKNTNISIKSGEIWYAITATNTDYCTITVSEEVVSSGDGVTVVAKSVTGYRITGYKINGVLQSVVKAAGESHVLRITDIHENKNIEFLYEAVTYNIVFENLNTSKGAVYVEETLSAGDKNKLAAAYTYVFEYSGNARFKISTEPGKVLKSIKIDGEEQQIAYNSTSFTFARYFIDKSIKVEIVCETEDVNTTGFSNYDIRFTEEENVIGAVKFAKTAGEKNIITVIPEQGYIINTVNISGSKGGEGKSIAINSTTNEGFVERIDNMIKISLGTDEFDGTATVTVAYYAKTFSMSATVTSGRGTVSTNGAIATYGSVEKVIVSADENYYISSFRVNGEDVPFVSDKWSNRVRTASGQYTSAVYTFITGSNMDIEVDFKLFSYKVSLDSGSVNGLTEFFIKDKDEETNRILHGTTLTIGMTADPGYHVEKVYINGKEADYIPSTTVANNNTKSSFECVNVTEDISVYVVYSINRYGFDFVLVNGTENFTAESDTGNRLECADATLIRAGHYGNIAYGDNFSFTVTPGTSKGYYVYSIRIVYSGLSSTEKEKTRTYHDDMVDDNGCTIWFNKFLWENSPLAETGVTGDIELIEVVFKKRVYNVDILQIGEHIGGTVEVSISNPINTYDGVVLYDGNDPDESNIYKYQNGKFSILRNGIYEETSIKLVRTDSGEWRFGYMDGDQYVYLDFYFEYGLRYSVVLAPTEGYYRSLFTLNRDDRNNNVSSNRYTFSVYRTTELVVEYTILKFDISVNVTVYDATSAAVSGGIVYQYTSVKLTMEYSDGTESFVELGGTSSSFVASGVKYGTVLKLYIQPNFEEYGTYLNNLQKKSADDLNKLQNINFAAINLGSYDSTGLTVYGEDGSFIAKEYTAFQISFRIMEYDMSTAMTYTESIKGEQINMLFNKDTGATRWKVTWNSNPTMKLVVGMGYYIKYLDIVYTETDGTERKINVACFQNEDFLENKRFGSEESGYIVTFNENDAVYGESYTVTVYGVKNNCAVTARFERESFDVIYDFNNGDYVDSIKTTLNANNAVYPTYYYTGHWVASHYYDEVAAEIKPKEGYKISAKELVVECVERVVDEDGNSTYYVLKDNNGAERRYTVKLTETGNGDERAFTFHQPSMAAADHYVDSIIRITIVIEIKQYSLGHDLAWTDSGEKDAIKNNTGIKTTIRTANNNYVLVGGASQVPTVFNKGELIMPLTAQHHGYIEYEFTASEGYMMSKFNINGYEVADILAENNKKPFGATDLNVYTITKIQTVDSKTKKTTITYKYYIKIYVTTNLIKGISGSWSKENDINVAIDITPITYDIRVILNNVTRDPGELGNRTGVTDGQQLSIYTQATVMHFASVSMETVLFEGYKFKDIATSIYIGTKDGCNQIAANKAALIADGVLIDGYISNLNFNCNTLANSDLSLGKNVVYFVFNTEIIKYDIGINAYVYSSKNVENGSIKKKSLRETSEAGTMELTVLEAGVNKTWNGSEIWDFTTNGQYFENLEYFTTIRIVAKANEGYAIYGIYECISSDLANDKNNDEKYTKISSGIRNISYTVNNGEHIVVITVKDTSLEKLGNRYFKIDFKEEAQITLTVENPYKYISSTRRYTSYTTVSAYTSENELIKGVPSSAYSIAGTEMTVSDGLVQKYEYKVYVGNYIKFVIYDNYAREYASVYYYNKNMAGIEFTASTLGDHMSTLTVSGTGEKLIAKNNNFYAYVDISGRLSTEKTTIGAIKTTNGGSVIYNGATENAGSTQLGTSTPGKIVTITVKPDANYEFYSIKARQPNLIKTKNAGFVMFDTDEASAWTTITKDQINDAEVLANFPGKNRIKVMSVTASVFNNNGVQSKMYTFKIWVCGDLEMEVEFYRTYAITYGVYRTDKVAQEGESNGITIDTITIEGVQDTIYGATAVNTSTNKSRVSYGASFEITATQPDGDYQFVGWHVNNLNLFPYLETLRPDDKYLNQTVIVNSSEMSSLISNKTEVTEITVYAIFQPIIDVMLFDEKYYAYTDHFNSWDLGTILASYYNYERVENPDDLNKGIVSASDTLAVVPEGQSITSAISMQERAKAADYSKEWSSLLYATLTNLTTSQLDKKPQDATHNYTTAQKNDNRVYSGYEEFSVLYQNITNADYLTNSWETGVITLNLASLATTTKFCNWQYFNWNANEWVDIAYQYEDKSLGLSSDGNYSIITSATYSNYSLSLSALYSGRSGSSVTMPYAISSTNPNNVVRNQGDVDGIRPLLIRANMYQRTTVTLTQSVYTEDFSNRDSFEEARMSETLVRPKLSTTPADYEYEERTETAPNGRSGAFEYGTTITLTNNADNPGAEIIYGATRFRFVGWFLKYNTGDMDEQFYLNDSEYERADGTKGSVTFKVALTCPSDTSHVEFNFFAVYVAQYKQVIYSYNISGGEELTYLSAASAPSSLLASPLLYISAPDSKNAIQFRVFTKNNTQKLDYNTGATKNKYFFVNKVSDNKRANTDNSVFNFTGREFEYYFDAGLTYQIELPSTTSTAGTVSMSSVKSTSTAGYCPETDTPYLFLKNEDGEAPIIDYRSYYNTGHATYWVDEKAVTAAYLRQKVNNESSLNGCGTIYTTKADAMTNNQYDFMYVSTATLIFYNLTYKGGVTLQSALALAVSGGVTGELTVWDEDATYGDYLSIDSNGKPIALGANGEVVVRVSLICNTNTGYQGHYKFAFAGMKNGNGFITKTEITGPSGIGLFSPMYDEDSSTFTRWFEVDLSTRTTTFLFGQDVSDSGPTVTQVGTHAYTKQKYTTSNCGDAVVGYKVFNTTQINNIEKFWSANGESCIGIIQPADFRMIVDGKVNDVYWENEEQCILTEDYANYYGRTTFKLEKNKTYNVTSAYITGKSSDPFGNVTSWQPLFSNASTTESYVWGTNLKPNREGGFDGILDGQNAIITGLMMKGLTGSLGLFAAISGGEVKNLYFDNAYVSSDSASFVGLLAGKIIYSTINSITFSKTSEYAIYSSGGYRNKMTGGTRVYLHAPAAQDIGLLAGYVKNSSVGSINVYVGASGKLYSIELNCDSDAGTIIGTVTGELSVISSLTVNGNGGWLFVGSTGFGDPTYAGGVIGVIEEGAYVTDVSVNNINMMVGSELTNAAGGIVGYICDENSVLTDVGVSASSMGYSTSDFTYDVNVGTINSTGIYIFSKIKGGYGVAANDNSVGKVGGIVGKNEGYVSNEGYTKDIKGVFKMYAGTIGGLVGLNVGWVNGFSLEAGYANSNFNGIMVLAWIAGKSYSYSVGGVVGTNIGKDSALSVESEDLTTYKISGTLKGMVTNCVVNGKRSVTSEDDNKWEVGHVYAFLRQDSEDDSFRSITMSDPTGNLEFTYKHNLIMGGIVGYNGGGVLNCQVNKSKMTFNIQNNATNKAASIDPFADSCKYSWGMESGFIVGMNDPAKSADTGWAEKYEQIILALDVEESLSGALALSGINYRIQSCYSSYSVIAAVGRVWMDNASVWAPSGYGNESLKCAISMGGIAGGSSKNAQGGYPINNCYAEGNKFVYKAVVRGSASKSLGWYTYEDDGGYNSYYTYCRRAFLQVQLCANALVAGINHQTDVNYVAVCRKSSAKVNFTKSDDWYDDTSYYQSYHCTSSSSHVNGWYGAIVRYEQNDYHFPSLYLKGSCPSGDTIRYTRYFMSNRDESGDQKDYVDSNISDMSDPDILESIFGGTTTTDAEQCAGYSLATTNSPNFDTTGPVLTEDYATAISSSSGIYGFYSNTMATTDPYTGMLTHCNMIPGTDNVLKTVNAGGRFVIKITTPDKQEKTQAWTYTGE